MDKSIYDLAEYYDIAFSRDVSKEVCFLINCFHKHSKENVKNILEPACGSGIYLYEFAKNGYNITGYDYNPKMVAYSLEQVKNLGYEDKVNVVIGDMTKIHFNYFFDGAINLINSLGHCFSDDDLLKHFVLTGATLKKGACYIIEFTCAYEEVEKEQNNDKWKDEKNGIVIETTWYPKKYDKTKKIRYVLSKMNIQEKNKSYHIEEEHKLRLWYYEDLIKLVNLTGFNIVAIYNQKYESIPLNSQITGDLGPLYYILVNNKNNK